MREKLRTGSSRPWARRLNRTEYNNTIRAVVGLNCKPADDFPTDDSGYGFNNIGDDLAPSRLRSWKVSGRGRKDCAGGHRAFRRSLRRPAATQYPGQDWGIEVKRLLLACFISGVPDPLAHAATGRACEGIVKSVCARFRIAAGIDGDDADLFRADDG